MFIFREPWNRYLRLLFGILLIYVLCFFLNRLSAMYDWPLHWSDNMFTTIVPIVLSIAMLDVTYMLGKLQTTIQKRQNEIAEQQCKLQEYQYKLDKYQHYKGLYKNLKELQRRLTEFRIFVNSSMCHPYFYSGRDVMEHAINELRILRRRIEDDEAAFTLKLPNDAFGFDDILNVFIHCERVVDRVNGYKISMQNIDKLSIEQVKLWYGPILSSIANKNPKINIEEIYALQGNTATFIEAVKVIIQKHIFTISEKYPFHSDSVDMLVEIIELLGYDKADIINWYSEIDKLMDKIYVQSDILNRIQKECAIDINN